ncbi:MAG: FAD-dependent oxidoreductase [Gammaproteobacteria bacterium]
MTQTNIAILGAGIAGLCCAIALHKKGFNVTLYERSAKPENSGAGLVLWPNASVILDKLALLDEIKSAGYSLSKMQRVTELGEYLNEIDLTQFQTKNNYSNYSITRKNLQDIFLNKIQQLNIVIHFNHQISEIESHTENTAVVHFTNGNTIEADIIIGADGRMNSIARKYVTGCNKPVYQGYVNWVGLLETDSTLQFQNNISDYWGCGERFGLVPLSKQTAYWAGCKVMPEGLGEPNSGNKKALLDIFENWPDSIKTVIELTPNQNIKRIEIYDHDPLPKWHRGNVCLIGDAAHAALPVSGQGACQAIEDAYQLAECLQQHEKNQAVTHRQYQSAFEHFFNRRSEPTSTIIQNARYFARSLFNTDPEYCETRNRKAKN